MTLYITGDKDIDGLVNTNAFALLVAMVLDQQIPLEKAFSSPHVLLERVGGKLDAKRIASMKSEDVVAAFVEKPALHRFPAAMAERVYAVAQIVMSEYGGDAAAIWDTAESGDELLKRLRALPGFGEQKARIFIALLAKRLGVKPKGWEKAAGAFGAKGSHVSVADIDSPNALLAVREHKRQMKAAAKSVAKSPRAKGKQDQEVLTEQSAQDRLGERRLYLCTPDRADLATFLEACIAGGVDIVQLREKELTGNALVERAIVARDICRAASVPFIINDSPGVAHAVDADGVHVGQDDISPKLAREIVGDKAIIGLSTHASPELTGALSQPIDYFSAGPIVETPTKPGRAGTGPGYIEEVAEVLRTRSGPTLPFFITGGVTPEGIPELVRLGATRFVVVRYLTTATDPFAAARRLRSAIDSAVEGQSR